MRFEELPAEAVARILSFLGWKDLLVVSSLSRFLREVYQSFPEPQLSYAMQTYAMINIDMDPTLNMRRKLSELERRERAWRELDLSHKVTVKVPHPTSYIYGLSRGIYLLGECKDPLFSRETQALRFFDLSTCVAGPAVREEPWPEIPLETYIVDIGFGLDEFDLIAIVGINLPRNEEQGSIVLSFRELSTGAPHPLAKQPDIFVDHVHGHVGSLSAIIKIVGPRLLLLLTWYWPMRTRFGQIQDKLLLFNWWEGRKTEIAPPSTWNDFVFLSPELIMLPNHNHTLEIARLPDVSKTCCSPLGFERVLILELPSLQPLVRIDKIRCRSEPNPKGAMYPRAAEIWSENTEYTRRKRRSPISPDPMKTIILLRFYYREYPNEGHDIQMAEWDVLRHSVSLVVQRQFLLDIAGELERTPVLADVLKKSDRGRKPCAPSLPWGLWGTNARWQADHTQLSHRILTSAGQRYIGIDENGHLVVKDFNPYAVRRAHAVQRPGYCVADEELKAGTGDEGGIGEMLGYRMDDGDNLGLGMESFAEGGADLLGSYCSDRERAGARFIPETEPSDPPPLSDINLGSPTGDGSLFYTPDSSIAPSSSLAPPVSASTSVTSSDPFNPVPSSDSPPSSNSEEDTTWQRIRIIEEYDEVEEAELRQLFNEKCSLPLPCVEYVSKESYDYHGLLMDDERIIGLRHDEHWSIVEFDVFTM